MLMRASRAAAWVTKQAGLLGSGLMRAGKFAIKKPGTAIGVGLTTGLTGMAVHQGLKASKAGLEPEYVQATQYRGVPAIPKM